MTSRHQIVGVNDHYETRPQDVQLLLDTIGACNQCNDAVVWDPFVCSGHSQTTIAQLGFRVVTDQEEDFFDRSHPPHEATVVVSNPPFSTKRRVLERLIGEWRLPFALILPSETVQRDYFLRLVQQYGDDWHLRVLLPNKTLRFHLNGVVNPHLPPFKLAIFVGRPREQDHQREQCTHQRRPPPTCASVTIGLFDYEQTIR